MHIPVYHCHIAADKREGKRFQILTMALAAEAGPNFLFLLSLGINLLLNTDIFLSSSQGKGLEINFCFKTKEGSHLYTCNSLKSGQPGEQNGLTKLALDKMENK